MTHDSKTTAHLRYGQQIENPLHTPLQAITIAEGAGLYGMFDVTAQLEAEAASQSEVSEDCQDKTAILIKAHLDEARKVIDVPIVMQTALPPAVVMQGVDQLIERYIDLSESKGFERNLDQVSEVQAAMDDLNNYLSIARNPAKAFAPPTFPQIASGSLDIKLSEVVFYTALRLILANYDAGHKFGANFFDEVAKLDTSSEKGSGASQVSS